MQYFFFATHIDQRPNAHDDKLLTAAASSATLPEGFDFSPPTGCRNSGPTSGHPAFPRDTFTENAHGVGRSTRGPCFFVLCLFIVEKKYICTRVLISCARPNGAVFRQSDDVRFNSRFSTYPLPRQPSGKIDRQLRVRRDWTRTSRTRSPNDVIDRTTGTVWVFA